MRIGYAKLGRSMPLNHEHWGVVGGDNEPPIMLQRLSRRHPDVEWVLIGRNSGEDPATLGFPPNVSNPWSVWRDEVRPKLKELEVDDHAGRAKLLTELTLPEFMTLDGIVIWCGQHGGANQPIPVVAKALAKGDLTTPQQAFTNYASYIINGVNALRDTWVDDPEREEVWLNPDTRNNLKARDLKWPNRLPVLAQYDRRFRRKMYRWGDTRDPKEFGYGSEVYELQDGQHWSSYVYETYSGLEIVGVPQFVAPQAGFEDRVPFGMIANEAARSRKEVDWDRPTIVRNWVLPLWDALCSGPVRVDDEGEPFIPPFKIRGTWKHGTLANDVPGLEAEPIPYGDQWEYLQGIRCTFATPTSGSGWPTLKAWESMASGVVFFVHPNYDDQGHVIPTLQDVAEGKVDHDDELKALAVWLRPQSPEQLVQGVQAVASSPETWAWLSQAQYRYYLKKREEDKCLTLIDQRLRLTVPA